MTRSIFLKNESYSDVQAALAKADTDEDYRHLISERLKANGWNKEKELKFREHCEVIGFSYGFQRAKPNPLAKDVEGRNASRLLADAIRAEIHHSKIEQD